MKHFSENNGIVDTPNCSVWGFNLSQTLCQGHGMSSVVRANIFFQAYKNKLLVSLPVFSKKRLPDFFWNVLFLKLFCFCSASDAINIFSILFVFDHRIDNVIVEQFSDLL